MSRIVMLLSHGFRSDPRVAREARALAAHGHDVTIVCWDRRGELPKRETYQGMHILRVQDVRSRAGAGWRQLLHAPRFWRRAIVLATDLAPDVVHCHDLDTLYAGVRIKRRCGCRLIYDAHENYAAMVSTAFPAPLVTALSRFERWLVRRADAIITASTVLRDAFLARGLSPVVAIGNYQELAPYDAVDDAAVRALRSDLGVTPNELLVAYIAGFPPNRMLTPLLEAAALLPQVQFHIWGDGLQRAVVEQAAAKQANLHYHGWLPEADLPRHFKAADVIYYCLRADHPTAAYNAPNTVASALAAGRPVIASNFGDLGRMVGTAECGVLLDEVTAQGVADAIERLQDPVLRSRLGANARRAARTTYNAGTMRRQLLELYEALGLRIDGSAGVPARHAAVA